MKQVLVIGSTVVDVIIHVDHLPQTQEDVHVLRQRMSLGGCAYNVSDMIRHFQVPYILFSPVGSGAYGDFVRAELSRRGVSTPIPSPEAENGCCYCFVELDGERTFLSYHGAEYRFERSWFQIPDDSAIDSVYLCGLEVEEPTGECIVEYLEAHPEYRIYFAPGPRLTRIRRDLLARLFALHPILHLNELEAFTFVWETDHEKRKAAAEQDLCRKAPEQNTCLNTAEQNICSNTAEQNTRPNASVLNTCPDATDQSTHLEDVARQLLALTGNDVIITLGERGTFYCTPSESGCLPGIPAHPVDTIGAGDSHIGAIIACRQLGLSLPEAIRTANRAAAAVVETEGALLSDEAFAQLEL